MNIFTVRPSRAKLVAWIFVGLTACFAGREALADDLPKHEPNTKVSAPTRIDWVFALSNQSPAEPPADWLKGYDSLAQTFELYVPKSLKKGEPPGLLLFISPGDKSTGLESLRQVCEDHHLVFASPHGAGNSTDTRKRVRIVLDVLDVMRRQHGVDPDRTYIGGFSGGGRIACAIGFSLPEYFGGVIPVCAAGDLRDETWLRHRVIDRLSVAHLTGDDDFNRGEVERYRGPLLAAVGVRSKVWVAPKLGHGIPAAPVFDEAVRWLDAGLPARQNLAKEFPGSRATPEPPSRAEQADRLLAEGKARLAVKAKLYSGLMQVKGALERWPDLATAEEAKAILLRFEEGADRGWEEADTAEQRKFLVARAKALSDYATGPLHKQYAAQRPGMAKAAARLWERVIADGQDEAAVAEGKKRLEELQNVIEGDNK